MAGVQLSCARLQYHVVLSVIAPTSPSNLKISNATVANSTGSLTLHFDPPQCVFESGACVTLYLLRYNYANSTADPTDLVIPKDQITKRMAAREVSCLGRRCPCLSYRIPTTSGRSVPASPTVYLLPHAYYRISPTACLLPYVSYCML